MIDKTLIIDAYNIKDIDLITNVKDITDLLDFIVKKCNLNVVGQCFHQFSPIGATAVYILSESHLSIHTFPEDKRIRVDLYCCNPNVDFNMALDVVYYFLNGNCNIKKRIF